MHFYQKEQSKRYAVIKFCHSNNSNDKYVTVWLKMGLSSHNKIVCYYHVTYDFEIESTLLSFPECQGTPCSKQEPYLKFKWQQQDLNPEPLS